MELPATKETAIALLGFISDDLVDLLSLAEKRKGKLPPVTKPIAECLQNLRITDYAKLYENERALRLLPAIALFDVEELKTLSQRYEIANASDREKIVQQVLHECGSCVDLLRLPETEAEKAAARALFNALSPEDQQDRILFERRFFLSVVTTFNQYLAVMVHREPMTTLVSRAKSGDDAALLKAFQIDHSVMDHIAYFRERKQRAELEGDLIFLTALGRVFGKPPYAGRVRHKALYFAFATLQSLHLLDTLTHDQMLDVLEESGLNLSKNRIEDVNALTKRLIEYRRLQKSGVVSMQ